MAYRIRGLDPAPFAPLFDRSDAELAAIGAKRCRVTATPGFPDRIELRDMAPGETALLVNHVHQPADTPYRASHAIYVREGATRAAEFVDAVPPALACRLISLRAFDADHMMVDADVIDGGVLDAAIRRMFGRAGVAYLQAHNARRGCFAATIERD
jgi:hypothetical protein